ncbi:MULTISPECIES: phosphocholine-specific phospholipase C [Pseudofrankia]|uniref:phosphocholine-specific phospholipase C n=1 Tax=Pseudofrankia TaxID=2994363 RepID=UPI000234BA9C|nr:MULTISPECIES: phospholipase C, phosphocholine-specific [Pseudofrankia]OHV37030.1 phospholipase C, phosphocholine-specific [Pseudofrankia sp. EUN1h]
MVDIDRRRFLSLAGGTAALVALDQSIARAAAIPANRRTGTIKDVEHIVVLMQENRSFDHYFGTLRGVRGFGEPHPVVLPGGKPVWNQPNGTGELLPFHPDAADLGAAFLTGLPHSWTDGHQALNNGVYNQWVPAKGTATMAYLQRQDAAFHYALADAFTVCDAYYCSFVGNTDPNRYYMWTGWTGNDGKDGGPVLYNDELGYDWKTYPERLEAAKISWKVYQDEGTGLDAAGSWGWTSDPYIGNYGDTSLLYFNTYRNAQPGSPLYEKARVGTKAAAGQDYFELLRADVKANKLPSISYVTAPEAFSEHSNWPSNYGAWYIAKVLDALTSNPDVWSKTVLLVTYDENDGFFDHLVPPHPNSELIPGASTVKTDNEVYRGPLGNGHYGLGPRVPMYVVSPWSVGGWVASETFDHTSIIQFMEKRFGVKEPNITPWRRAICGDLTSAFDFSKDRTDKPKLPDTSSWAPKDRDRHPTYNPAVPATGTMPKQERGQKPARPTPYDLSVHETSKVGAAILAVEFENDGRLGAHFQARLLAPVGVPHSYTVGSGAKLKASWPVAGDYDVHIHGPNGFFRRFAGTVGKDKVYVEVRQLANTPVLQVSIDAPKDVTVDVRSAYDKQGGSGTGDRKVKIDTKDFGNWYDVTVSVSGTKWVRTFAGHLEDGKPSVSDPQLGA